MIKNALDYIEDTRTDDRVYLDGMPVGCVAVAYGWQATVSTLHSLRVTVHALRGWPSPLGATVNASSGKIFDETGACTDDSARFQLQTVAKQVVEFAARRAS
jgi:FMN reductase